MGKNRKSHSRNIEVNVNGESRFLKVEPNDLLINVIREDLNLTGAKYGCGTGECGACTVLLDGVPVLSCLTLAIEADGAKITTIEGMSDEVTNTLRKSFLEEGAVQCGYCTSGMIIMAKTLLERNLNPTEEEIREFLSGNLCRCTGYTSIVEAIKTASEKLVEG